MRIAVAGTGRLGLSLLRPLLASSHEVVAIVADGRKERGVRRVIKPRLSRHLGIQSNLPGWARRLDVPLIWIDKMDEAELAPLRAVDPDILLVGGFGIILKEPLLSLPRIGCVNTHSSLLPRHRGPNPFSAAILAGDKETGVTFHVMDAGIDTGAILAQYAFDLNGEETMLGLFRRACDVAGEKVVEVMDQIAEVGLQGRPQPPGEGNYEKKKTVADAWIDWRASAEEIDRLVRGMAPNILPRFSFRGGIVRVARTRFEADPVDAAPGTVLENHPRVWVATGQGRIQLAVTYASLPVPWIWPAPWSCPAVGESLLPPKEDAQGA